ncbi:sulfite dehydrogenase [Arenibacterium halophilum]|uniref:Sulfite dehydrogenase n=1 Tax=Arenibacterium halophilum TaxID=2583821 RepID=A0ABY2XDG4_9RHOB|nr:sulfite dehydrogenase [Arenibacterium halophilum]TMV15064.1 sulfite dehydrogenase [Arenibacterium halophilum]
MSDAAPPSRRAVLTGAAAAMVAGRARADDTLITQVQPWSRNLGDPVAAAPYGLPTPHEFDVVRRTVDWLTADAYSSVSFTPIHALDGTITPQGCAFERHHSGAIDLRKEDYRLMVMGDVARPLVFTYADLERFPRDTRVAFCECAANSGMEWRGAQLNGAQYSHGMIHNMEYTGVPLRLLLEEAGYDTSRRWVYVEGADAASNGRSIPIKKALDDVLVAFKANGEALRREHGYPVRLVVPGFEGNLWIKWLRRIEVRDTPVHSREETSKYTDTLADGISRQFTFAMDAKSVITAPSPQAPVRHGDGPLVISGLAWSGRGAITRVDVTLDGGQNWKVARLAAPPAPMALCRFYLDVAWDGAEMLLQSRAIDDTGYVQPTKAQLHAARGMNSTYHNNGIQTWLMRADGSVENVEVS